MKSKIFNVLFTLCLIAILAVFSRGYIQKADADVQSLGYTRPAAGDVVQVFDVSTGAYYGINWASFSRDMLRDVNWTGWNITTTGATNWNYIGQ